MFSKDLLLIDEEHSGTNPDRHDLIQLAGVLLDKKTLTEKKSFTSYIKPAHWKRREPEAMAVNRISFEQLKNAPSLKNAIKKFDATFPKNVILSYYAGVNDIVFLQKAYKKLGKKFPFDYHFFNIWGLFFTYTAKINGFKNSKRFARFGLEDLIKKFKLTTPPLHDALTDCRVEAEILRRIIKQIKV